MEIYRYKKDKCPVDNEKRIETSEEVLAVISSAVASIIAKPDHKLVVIPIKRVPQTSPVWRSIGRGERLRNNYNTRLRERL